MPSPRPPTSAATHDVAADVRRWQSGARAAGARRHGLTSAATGAWGGRRRQPVAAPNQETSRASLQRSINPGVIALNRSLP
jgi:hypothetical protein